MILALATAILVLACGAYGQNSTPEAAATVDWYGYLRFDMAYDSAVSNPGNYALYVKPHAIDDATSTLSITARQTRLGARITRGTLRGRLEIDFYGSSPENKNTVMLRYAAATVPLGSLRLEAGQTSDLFSPLVPLTVNYSVAWGAGNVGYRRPQVKLIRDTGRTYLGLSLARNITGDLDGDSVVDGSASAVPAVQARCAVSPPMEAGSATLGVSGHYGKGDLPAQDIDYNNWSTNIDATLAVGPWKLLGEAYRGANMGQYAGAIFNSDTVHGVHSTGGWGNLQYRVAPTLTITLGASLDDVDREDLTEPHTLEDGSVEAAGTDVRVRNQVAWVGGLYKLTPEVVLGLELSRWATEYANLSPGREREPSDLRLQWSLQANF